MAGFWHRTAVYWGLSEPREELSAAPAEAFESGPVDAWIAARSVGASDGPAVFNAPITRDFALQVPAVLRGRNLICTIATLPLRHYNAKTLQPERSTLLEQIDPDVANVVTLAQTVEDLLFDAVSWWQILATSPGPNGFPTSARHLELDRVSLDPPNARAAQALPSGVDVRSVVWIDGKPVSKRDVIRFDSPNPPLLVAARSAIRRARLLDSTAAMYAENPRAQEIFEPSEDADPDEAEVVSFLNSWMQARRTRSAAYKPGAFVRSEVGTTSPADLQLVQLQARASLDLANAIGLDPEELGVSTTSRTYANVVDRRKDKINDTLSFYMQAITQRLSMNDVTKRGYAAEFALDDYMRADPKTRAEVQAIYLANSVVDAAEVRADEGLPPRQIEPPAAAPVAPVEPAHPAEPANDQPAAAAASRREVIQMRRDLPIAATFSADPGDAPLPWEAADAGSPRRITFTVPIGSDFAVDLDKRTITGLAVPYGEVTSDGRQVRFAPGSIEATPFPEPVLMAHGRDNSVPLGVVRSVSETTKGQRVVLAISKTPRGDEALVLADDRAISGMSVGVDLHSYEIDTESGDITVTRAVRHEISLTPFPAFESARITKVTLTQQKESTAMSDTLAATGAAAAAPAPAAQPVTVTEQFTAAPVAPAVNVTVQMPETFAADVATAMGEARAFVDPDRRPAGALSQVREALPYRFDGRRGPNGHDFSTDLFATDPQRPRANSAEAAQRLEVFMREVFADVSTGDVNELNPTRNRPDMYVAALEYATPIWDAINKGGIADATPFTVPQFSSSSGLVADHSESTEPTGGTFVTTSQTVTPGAMSGKVEITRETIDQGGNPAVSGLIWNEILRAWNEALEAKAVAVLEALTPTAIALTAGAADDVLAGLIEGELADLQFVAGGARMRELFLNKALFRALVNAVDSTGRKLYPFLAAQNASGQVSSDFGSINVGGLVARPSWALPTSASAVESSYLFSSSDVHGWASAPQRLQFEYEVKSIWLGVWGYAATACTRLAGVREITFDPTA